MPMRNARKHATRQTRAGRRHQAVGFAIETAFLPANGPLAQLGAAAYFAVLAYPRDFGKRDEFVEAVEARLLKSWVQRAKGRERTWRRSEIGSRYARFKNERIAGIFGLLLRRILKRLLARGIAEALAVSCMPQMQIEMRRRKIRIAFRSRYGSSLQSAALEAGDRMRGQAIRERPGASRFPGDYRNVLRTLRESQAVLHLAMAVPFDRDENGRPAFDQGTLWRLICQPDWLEKALKTAELLRCQLLPTFYPRYSASGAVCLIAEKS